MKKFALILALVLTFSTVSALADMTLYTAYPQNSVERKMADAVAETLSDALGTKVACARADGAADAADAFLADAEPDHALLFCDPETLILSLQGYTAADLRKAMRAEAKVAASGSMLCASKAALQAAGGDTYDALYAYSEKEPYTLMAARLLDASPTDYLTLEGISELYADQELYMDYAEMAEAAVSDAQLIIVVSKAMLPQEITDVMQPVCDTDLPGVWLGVFCRAEAGENPSVAAALQALYETDAWQALLAEGQYNKDTFAPEVTQLFANYVRYMTAEGLFFYEE